MDMFKISEPQEIVQRLDYFVLPKINEEEI